MKPAINQNWEVTPPEARRIQLELAPRVSLVDTIDPSKIKTVAGVDNGYVTLENDMLAFAAVVVMTFPSLEVIETVVANRPVTFPYVPGLLTFREAPAVLAALEQLKVEPDVLLFDGHGVAHPKRFGLAAHLGVVLDWPSIGCAKSKLTGTYKEPAFEFGSVSPLTDRSEVIGTVLRSLPGHAPVFISPGHKMSLASATEIALACCTGKSFMPAPTQAAHDEVAKATAPFRAKHKRGSVTPAPGVRRTRSGARPRSGRG
jgi:deoxyribonuclease V